MSKTHRAGAHSPSRSIAVVGFLTRWHIILAAAALCFLASCGNVFQSEAERRDLYVSELQMMESGTRAPDYAEDRTWQHEDRSCGARSRSPLDRPREQWES